MGNFSNFFAEIFTKFAGWISCEIKVGSRAGNLPFWLSIVFAVARPKRIVQDKKIIINQNLENDEFDEIRHRQVGCCNHRGYEG